MQRSVRFQVLTAASMMFRVVFWDILPCKMIVDLRQTRLHLPITLIPSRAYNEVLPGAELQCDPRSLLRQCATSNCCKNVMKEATDRQTDRHGPIRCFSSTLQVLNVVLEYSEGSGFKSRLGDRLSLPRRFVLFLGPSRQMPG
jgi:hypothetical protein